MSADFPPTDSAKQKILIVINELWVGGGAEKTAAQLANHLHATGHAVQVVTLYDGETTHAVWCPHLVLGERPTSKWQKLVRIPRNLWRLRRAVRQHQPDTTVCFLEEASFTYLVAARLFRFPGRTVVSVRNNVLALSKIYQLATKYLYRRAAAVVCVTRRVAYDLEHSLGLSNTTTIYNSIDLQEAQAQAAQPLAPPVAEVFAHRPTVVALGRLHPQKGYVHLLRAFSKVLERIPDARLAIIGDGPQEQRLHAFTKQLGLTNSVHFLGAGHRNVYNILAAADVYVMSSLFEGMPNTMLEALAVGLPVVSTDCVSGPREILAPERTVTEPIDYPYRTKYGTLVVPFDLRTEPGWQTTAVASLSDAEQQLATELQSTLEAAGTVPVPAAQTRAHDFAPAAIMAEWEGLFYK